MIEVVTLIAAPIERVFDLARSIDLHTDSASKTNERAVAGVTTGLINLGEKVTWRGRHFGVWQTLTVQITAFERPTFFADQMVRGAFHRLEHRHHFAPTKEGTRMTDELDFESPLGALGRLTDRLFLSNYLRAFLIERNHILKQVAESDGWQQYLASSPV